MHIICIQRVEHELGIGGGDGDETTKNEQARERERKMTSKRARIQL